MKFTGYVNQNTLLHRLDPRIKILWFLGVTVLTVFTRNLPALIVLLAGALSMWLLSGLLREVGSMVRKFLPLLVMAFVTWIVIGAANDSGGAVLFSAGSIQLEQADLIRALVSTCRIFLMVSSFYTLIMTTNFSEMIYGLQRFGIPFKAAFMCGLVLQIIPMMIAEFQTIADAQRARGLELDKGGIVTRIRKYSTVLFPLFIRTIQAGQSLALAMHLYQLQFTRRRTSHRQFRIARMDWGFLAVHLVLWTLAVNVGIQLS